MEYHRIQINNKKKLKRFVIERKCNSDVFLALQPERIDPRASSRGYDVRSDVWSLGITLVS